MNHLLSRKIMLQGLLDLKRHNYEIALRHTENAERSLHLQDMLAEIQAYESIILAIVCLIQVSEKPS